MKKMILLSAMLCAAVVSKAQPLNANEMLQMLQCADYNCFSKLVEPKGYVVSLNKETAGYKTYQYKSKLTYQNESNGEIALPYVVEFIVHMDDKATTLSHTVGSKNQRELLLTDFQVQGFEYVEATKTRSNFDNNAVVYKSKAHPGVVLKITNYEKKARKKMYVEFEFELWRANADHPTMISDTTKKQPTVIKQ